MKRVLGPILRPLLAHVPALQYRKSYALNSLDQRLEPFLMKRRGFFVEAGANNGMTQSNTLYFEKYLGWSGLLIEPVPQLAEQCRINRPHCIVEQAALVSSEFEGDQIVIHACGLMSVTEGAFDQQQTESHLETGRQFLKPGETTSDVSVPARTLTSIFEQHQVPTIDLLSLDIEGYEHEALAGLDFDRYGPAFLLIEVRNRQLIESVLPANYEAAAILSMNPDYQDILYQRTGDG